MQLHVRQWPGGDKLAILIHGIVSDSRSWIGIAPRLQAFGYRVLAPDLRGHGLSPRGDYSLEAWAADLVDSLPQGADLVIGHSLGGAVLSLCAERLAPLRAVYEDPAWVIEADRHELAVMGLEWEGTWGEAEVRDDSPQWTDADVQAKLEALALWDSATAKGFFNGADIDLVPERAVCPSLILLPDLSYLVPEESREALEQHGFSIRTVPGSGHSIHRDNPEGFIRALDGWL